MRISISSAALMSVGVLCAALATAGCADDSGATQRGLDVSGDTFESPGDTGVADGDDVDENTTTPPRALTLTALEPDFGATTGLEEVTLTGTGLLNVIDVRFGAASAVEFFPVSDQMIVILTPPMESGIVDVVVTDDLEGRATLERGYQFRQNVQITSVEPAQGDVRGGQQLTITGVGFDADAAVVIGGRLAPVISLVDQDTLQVVAPAGVAGMATLFVSVGDGVAEWERGFIYTERPQIDRVRPAVGSVEGGTVVDVYGSGFWSPVSPTLGGVGLGQVEILDDGHLRGVVPAAQQAGAVDLTVVTEVGVSIAPNAFVYLDPASPADGLDVHGVWPATGRQQGGEVVSVVVTGLEEGVTIDDVTVMIGGVEATVDDVAVADGIVRAITPAGARPGDVDVTIAVGADTVVLATGYRYVGDFGISEISPAEGPATGGQAVIVKGFGFGAGAVVTFGALPATSIEIVDSETLSVVTPVGSPGPVDVVVTQGGAEEVLEGAFDFQGEPAIWVVDPAAGAVAGGTWVRIEGYGFAGTPRVIFGGSDATSVRVINEGLIEARTPRGYVGPTDVRVMGGGVDVVHPNGFTYFEPASQPGTWGGPVDGSVNVTVIDAGTGLAVAGAYVVVGPSVMGPYSGLTDGNGQITFSGPDLMGEQMVAAAAANYGGMQLLGFNARNVTVAIEPVPECSEMGDVPCDQVTSPPPSATLNLNVLDASKGPTRPWGLCSDWDDDSTGLCTACANDAACGDGQHCSELGYQGWFCTAECETDGDCNGEFVCLDPTGQGIALECVPPPGDVMTFCDVTELDMWAEDAITYPGKPMSAAGSVSFNIQLGTFAAYCWRGVYVRGTFRPQVLGVTRGLSAYEDRQQVFADVRMDIPLTKTVTVEIDRPRMGRPGQAVTQVRTLLNLGGGDGVLEFPPLRAFEGRVFDVRLPARLSGDIGDASYDIFVAVEVEEWAAYSAHIERRIKDFESDRGLRLGADGWEITTGVDRTVRGMAAAGDQVIAVGDSGMVLRSFAGSHWASQGSRTDWTLNAVAADDSGGAIAVGEGGVATHWDGLVWNVRPTGVVAPLTSVAMPGPEMAFATAGHQVLRWDGAVWGPFFGAAADLNGIWSPGQGVAAEELANVELWVAGAGGYVGRKTAGGWVTVATEVTADLNGIWGVADADGVLVVYAVGAGGTVLRWTEATGFVVQDVPTRRDLFGIWGRSANTVWAVGGRGAIVQLTPGDAGLGAPAWEDQSNAQIDGSLYAVMGSSDRGDGAESQAVWAMGAHELVIGPMLAIPENVSPSVGGFLGDRVSWTVQPSVEPDFQMMQFGGQAGPCSACGMMFMIPYGEWTSVADGDLNAIDIPEMRRVISPSPLTFGFYETALYRVLADDSFDFDDTASNGFFNVGYKSWSARSLFYIR